MPDRYDLDFKILTSRQPIKRSPSGSILRAVAKVVKDELGEVVTAINRVNDARLINTSDSSLLDKHGVKLDLERYVGEFDVDYRQRLLAGFRDIPDGLTREALIDAVTPVIVPHEVIEWWRHRWEWPGPIMTAQGYFGLETIGASALSIVTDSKVACKFTVANHACIHKLWAYLEADGAGTRSAYAAIYADVAGTPTTRLGLATNNPVVVDDAGWYEFDFGDVVIDAGTDYWLAIGATGGSWKIYYDAGGVNQGAWNADAPPPNDPFGAVGSWNNNRCSFYAGYVIGNPEYVWNKWFNSYQTRWIVSVVVSSALTEGQLDTIETNVVAVKPAHVVVWIVRDQTTYHELLREIL